MTITDEIAGLAERMDGDPSFKDCNDAAAMIRALTQENERQAAIIAQIQPPNDIGDNCTAELAVKCAELEAENSSVRNSVDAVRAEYLQRYMNATSRISELEAERDEWKERAERPWAIARKRWEDHYNHERKRADAIRAKTFEECAQAMVFLPEGQRKVAQEAIHRIAIRALAQTDGSKLPLQENQKIS